jgi:hypothetical protein
MVIFIGGGGLTDAGGIIWDGHRFKKVPGWNPEAVLELGSALKVIGAAARLKTPGLAEAAAKSVTEFVNREIGAHAKEGTVVVIG